MAHWIDFFKIFTYAGAQDPLSRRNKNQLSGAGVRQSDAVGWFGNNMSPNTGNLSNLRQSQDMIDTTVISNRLQRYREYERLRNIAEIEIAMNVISDEACVSGDTKVVTPFGNISIKELAEKHQEDRFLVYCWDFHKHEYSLGWAYAPRKTKLAHETVVLALDNGKTEVITPDHRVLLQDETWKMGGDLKPGDKLKAFYRVSRNRVLNDIPYKQQPRIFTSQKGWMNERDFLDYWQGKENKYNDKLEKIVHLLGKGCTINEVAAFTGWSVSMINTSLHKGGFTAFELQHLNKKKPFRRIVGICKGPACDVYDLSVDTHKCFASENVIFHNCQKDDNGDILKIVCKDQDVKKEANNLLFSQNRVNLNRNGWSYFKSLIIKGDYFAEVVIDPDNPQNGVARIEYLPPDSMYRLETTKGKLIEFQQTKEGPDIKAAEKNPLNHATDVELATANCIRFAPNAVIHFRLGENRENWHPYGQSLIEPARGPAHNLRLMEDSMVVYRLVRAPERKVFYVDTGNLTPAKALAYLDRMKDLYRKRKVAANRGLGGSNMVEEKWQPPAVDEELWIPTRANSQTRVDTLPGASNLGEIDDAVYFRQKLLMALNFPRNYFNSEDPSVTRVTLSSQDTKFARFVERLQSHFEDGILELLHIHFQLRGFPEESYSDLKVKMTPPSEWRELSRAEITSKRINDASSLKTSKLYSTYDIYKKIFKMDENECQEAIARLKIDQLEELKLQIVAQNPGYLGVGIPGGEEQNKQELGTEPGGPNFNPDMASQDQGNETPPEAPPHEESDKEESPLPDAEQEDIQKYDLEMQDYENEMDREDIDRSFGDN